MGRVFQAPVSLQESSQLQEQGSSHPREPAHSQGVNPGILVDGEGCEWSEQELGEETAVI